MCCGSFIPSYLFLNTMKIYDTFSCFGGCRFSFHFGRKHQAEDKKNRKLFPCLLRYSCYKRINRPKFIRDLHKFYSHLWQDESISIGKKSAHLQRCLSVSQRKTIACISCEKLYRFWCWAGKKSTDQTFPLFFLSTMKNTGVAKRNARRIKHTMYQHRELSLAKLMWGGKFILMSQYAQMN